MKRNQKLVPSSRMLSPRLVSLSGLSFFSLMAVLSGVSVAQADFVQCNGVWTDKPCEGSVGGTIPQSVPPSGGEDPGRSEKRSLLHELTMKSIKAREEYELSYDVRFVQEWCMRKETTVDACRERVDKEEASLDKKMIRASALVDEKRKRKQEEEEEKIKKTQSEANATQVTVVQNIPRRPIIQYPNQYPNYPQYPNQYPNYPNSNGSYQGNSPAYDWGAINNANNARPSGAAIGSSVSGSMGSATGNQRPGRR